MSQPLVSIIIPCHNAEPWIESAITSALEQTWNHVEVIVIDDGSTDGSLERIKRFGRAVRWETVPRAGACAARNRGITISQGERLQFLDADDILLPDCVEGKLAFSCDTDQRVCCNVAGLETDGSEDLSPFWNRDRYDLDTILRSGSPPTPGPLHYRAELEALGGFRSNLPCAQEFDLHLRMALHLNVCFVSNGKTGALIRATPGSVSRASGVRVRLAVVESILHAWNTREAKTHLGSGGADVFSQALALSARSLYRQGAVSEATSAFAHARRLSSRWHVGTYKSKPATALARTIGFSAFERLHALARRSLDRPRP